MNTLPRTTPEAAGISSEALSSLLSDLNSKISYLNSIMILRHGKVCLEGWWAPFSPHRLHALFSLSKSFTSCAIGLARREGLLELQDKIISFFPEYEDNVTDEKMLRVTIEDLLTMRSGHELCAKVFMDHDPDENWVRGFLSSPLKYEPGTHFAYNSAGTHILAAIIRRVTGENVREYLMPRLFQPLGIVPGPWESSPDGTDCGGWGLSLCTEDLAKVGQLLLQQGVWEGEQLLPADYLAEAVRPQADNSANLLEDWQQGYGYQFWISRHGFRGDGASGQYIIVLPEQDMTIAVTSCAENMQNILTLFWDKLLPALRQEPLPENPEAQRVLQNQLAALAMPVCPAGQEFHPGADCREFYFRSNKCDIQGCVLEYNHEKCDLTFLFPDREEHIRAGFGFNIENCIRIQDSAVHMVIASAGWTGKDKLAIQVFYLDTTFRDTFTIDLQNQEKPISCDSRCNTFRPLFPRLQCVSENADDQTTPAPASGRLIYAASENNADLWYVTGFSAPDPFLWVQYGDFEGIIVNSMEVGRARKQAHSRLQVIDSSRLQEYFKLSSSPDRTVSGMIAAVSRALHCPRWEVPGDFPLNLAEKLTRRRISVTPCSDFFPERAVKTDEEIEKLAEGERLAEAGMYRAFQVLKESEVMADKTLRWRGEILTSALLRGEIDGEIARKGGVAFGTIVACGKQASDPHQAGFGPICADQPIVMDIFPRVVATGYFGDLTRTVVKGKASPVVQKAFQAVRQAQRAAIDLLKEGVTGAEGHAAAADTFEKLGYKTGLVDGVHCGFIHSTGHSVGLEIHESPGLSPRNNEPLMAGNAVTVEPGLYYPEWGGIRIEDLVVVTRDGCRDLTTIPVFLEL